MLNLNIIQGDFGDCFILEYGSAAEPRFILIDGGPENVYSRHLRGELQKIGAAGHKLELAMLSHVDGDHITGLLDLASELEAQLAANEEPLVEVGALWMNSFDRTIGAGTDIAFRMSNAFASTPNAAAVLANSQAALHGIAEGNRLRVRALQLQIPLNPGFPNELICVDDGPNPLSFDNLTLQVVGPTRANLDTLRNEWIDWLDRNEDAIAAGDVSFLANRDRSIPNLSSIMALASAHGRTILFTGDGRSDHLLDGLGAANLLDAAGRLHVDVLKVMHHGSDRNATRTFFRRVTADTYVVSANYNPDNPDLSTLIWMVESARVQGRQIRIMATNPVNTLGKLVDEYPPADYGYQLDIMPSHYHYWRLELA